MTLRRELPQSKVNLIRRALAIGGCASTLSAVAKPAFGRASLTICEEVHAPIEVSRLSMLETCGTTNLRTIT